MTAHPSTPPPPPDPHDEAVAQFAPKPERRWTRRALHGVAYAAVLVVGVAIGSSVGGDDAASKDAGSLAEASDAPSEADEVEPVEPVEPVEEEPEPVEPEVETDLSVRGNTIKALGDTTSIYDTWDDRHKADFVVTDIEVTSEIQTEYGDAPENGHFVILSIEGTTTQEITSDDLWYINPHDFSLFTPEGERVNEAATFAAYTALDSGEELPDRMGPGEQFSGKVALDSPTEHGVIAYGGGVEWEF